MDQPCSSLHLARRGKDTPQTPLSPYSLSHQPVSMLTWHAHLASLPGFVGFGFEFGPATIEREATQQITPPRLRDHLSRERGGRGCANCKP